MNKPSKGTYINAIAKSDLSPAQRFVAIMVANAMRTEEQVCWASQATLSESTGYSVSTIRRSLRQLQELGWLHGERSEGKTTRYTLRTPSTVTGDPLHGDTPSTANPGHSEGDPGHSEGDPGHSDRRYLRPMPKNNTKKEGGAREPVEDSTTDRAAAPPTPPKRSRGETFGRPAAQRPAPPPPEDKSATRPDVRLVAEHISDLLDFHGHDAPGWQACSWAASKILERDGFPWRAFVEQKIAEMSAGRCKTRSILRALASSKDITEHLLRERQIEAAAPIKPVEEMTEDDWWEQSRREARALRGEA